MSAPAIIHSPREQWLAKRREMVTASDVAAIIGEDSRRGPLQVYLDKIGEVGVEETPWMRWGRRVEAAIAEGYAEETGRPLLGRLRARSSQYELAVHPDIPWLGATPDETTLGSDKAPAPAAGEGPLECKAVAGFKAHEWKEQPPLAFQVQHQVQMACTGARWGSLCALFGGISLSWVDQLRSDSFFEALIPQLELFRWHVRNLVPPEADGRASTSKLIRALYSDESGAEVDLDAGAVETVTLWEAAKADAKAAEDRKDEAENKLRMALGDATFGLLPDGTCLTLKTTKRDGYVVQPTTFRVLRHAKRR